MRLEHGLGRAATPKLERVNVQIPLRVSSVTFRGTTKFIDAAPQGNPHGAFTHA